MQLWRAVALLFVLAIAAGIYGRLPGKRASGTFATDPPTPYSRYTPPGTSLGRILVIHGLDANRNVMNVLCYTLSEAGFEVISLDLPGHGDSKAPFNALKARDVVEQVLDELGTDTIVLGHSFGGALLLDIANDRSFATMILVSPAPTPLEHVRADRILVLESQFDVGGIRAFAPQIRAAATGLVEYRDVAWTGHSGGLFRPDAIKGIVEWLGGRADQIHTTLRLALLVLMVIVGIGAGISLLAIARVMPLPKEPAHSLGLSIIYYTAAACLAALIMAFVNAASWLRLFATDYLIGFFFLTGIMLFVRHRPRLQTSSRNLLIAVAAAAYLLTILGWPLSELTHIVVSGPRWWRFFAVSLLSLPLFLVDETLLRPIRSRTMAAGIAITTRLLLGALVASGVLILNRQAGFLLLLMHMVIVFWIALWFGGELVRKRTDPLAAAAFAAIVQAWVFSAVFVTT